MGIYILGIYRYMSGPRWSPVFKMESVLSVSSLNITTNNVLVVQLISCVRLFWDPVDCSPPGSSVYGISQARILEWVAVSFFRGSS